MSPVGGVGCSAGQCVVGARKFERERDLLHLHSLHIRSTKDKTICSEGETTGLPVSGDLDVESNEDALSDLSDEVVSKLSRSVVSLVLSDGETEFFTCSGIAVQRKGPVSGFLTSTSLVKALNDKIKNHGNLKIVAHHEDNVVMVFLGGYDLDHGIATVNVKDFPDLDAVVFRSRMTFPPLTNVVALGRDNFGKLLSTHGVLKFETGRAFPSHIMSTCKISKENEGGPLFDVHGNFLGMNLSACTEGTFCLPEVTLSEQWINILWLEDKSPAYLNSFKIRVGESSNAVIPNSHHEDDIILANNFEEPFGDIYGKGVWSKLSRTIASNMHENIVALASFNGGKRIFACSGCFIEWNGCTTILTAASLIRDSDCEYDIVKNLRIEVLLPSKKRAAGILQHYNLHYNIALVRVNDYRPSYSHPLKIQHQLLKDCEVVAVGCIFKSGELMASRGEKACMMYTYDCKFLMFSTCTITKAGIGGPLLDFDGNIVGMNFYDKYAGGSVGRDLDVLGHFKKKRTVDEAGLDDYASNKLDWTIAGDRSVMLNRWLVPLPTWYRPDDMKRHDYKMELKNVRSRKIFL
ncbi:uncharacterized protein [Miscanthus floridulus]|uniref:uncharacterized protein n=1 Tax=Miscanthus floridulus TaxID=154761 RepID=UPI003458006E